ncbi:hypothetical protein EJ08DRAFT_583792 [Tothia fuscella]|uniref:Actin-like ATPase domain-containing protein n=1 Tax=Tothia fuscella TaxID=1048955 RepID=A0A9P4U182_9PEZI|nr:hypothetical protein EJ08DRAFT_583792 [Tothia fuscella]
MSGREPDFIVGIDVGMTCSGVAFINLAAGSKTTRWIQRWPGKSDVNENKCSTIVVYNKSATHQPPTSGGFKSESEAERADANRVYREWFKTRLGPLSNSAGEQEVERWYRDYLQKLYEHIERTLSRDLFGKSWQNAVLNYIFSVPTSWDGAVVENFRRLAISAGFEHPSRPAHSIIIGMTEPEAVAVHTSIEAAGRLEIGQTILICDAGGGTTDLSILKIIDSINGSISMKQLLTVCGEDIGSTFIDAEFQKLVEGRLAPVEHLLNQSIPELTWEMMKSRDFQDNKCTFGDHGDAIERFPVQIPDFPRQYTSLELAAELGHIEVKIQRQDLKLIFDQQILKIQNLIDRELQRLMRHCQSEEVTHLILSGGLSNSVYVQDQIRKRYAHGASGFSNARNTSIWVAPDPQLADSVDGKLYVPDAIRWFIKKGEPVSSESPIERRFKTTFACGENKIPRKTQTAIVISHDDPEVLPLYLSKSVSKVCDLTSDLSSIDEKQFTEKNKRFWKRLSGKQRCYECTFYIKVNIGPADIFFELWFNGSKLSRDNAVQVVWQTVEETNTNRARPLAELEAIPMLSASIVAD